MDVAQWDVAAVGDWLRQIGLGDFAATFEEEVVDGPCLLSMTTDELKSLGLKMGHVKRLQRELAGLTEAPVAHAKKPTSISYLKKCGTIPVKLLKPKVSLGSNPSVPATPKTPKTPAFQRRRHPTSRFGGRSSTAAGRLEDGIADAVQCTAEDTMAYEFFPEGYTASLTITEFIARLPAHKFPPD